MLDSVDKINKLKILTLTFYSLQSYKNFAVSLKKWTMETMQYIIHLYTLLNEIRRPYEDKKD